MSFEISDVSRCVARINASRVYEDGTRHSSKASMTGFFWKHGEHVALITNWHNVTGLRPDNLATMGSFFPNTLQIEYLVGGDRNDQGTTILRKNGEIHLYSDDGACCWREHPRRHEVDLAAIFLDPSVFGGYRAFCLNDIQLEIRWKPEVGSDCFVVGFPEGLFGPGRTPIWKRASIASEPWITIDGDKEIFVDVLGNEGMSGSPVIAQSSGVFSPDGELNDKSFLGSWRNFLGVYSGRTSETGVGFQLGRVWKEHHLKELLERGVRGVHPLIN